MPIQTAESLWSSLEDAAGTRETGKMPALVRGVHPHQVARPRTAPIAPTPIAPAPTPTPVAAVAPPSTPAAGLVQRRAALDDEPSDGVPLDDAALVSREATGGLHCDTTATAPLRAPRAGGSPATAAPPRPEPGGHRLNTAARARRRPLRARPAR